MSDFRALSSFIDQVVKAAQPINEGSKDYFFSIIDPQELAELARETWHYYKAAEDEIQLNVSQLKDKKEEIVNYLNEVKAFMDEPPLFRSMVIEGSEFVNKGLIIPNSQLSTSERTLQQINQLVTQAWDLDPVTGLNAGSGQLSFSSKKYIAFLRLYEAGAYECWKRIEATAERHMRLAQLPVGDSPSTKRRKAVSSDSDPSIFAENVGLKITTNTIDIALQDMKAIAKTSTKDVWEITEWGNSGHPFVAVMRLLIHFNKAHDTTRGNLKRWVDFFLSRYGVDIKEGCSKQQIKKANTVFKRAITQAYASLTRQMPALKSDFKLPI